MKQRLLIIISLIIVLSLGYGLFRELHTPTVALAPVATTTDVVHCSNDAKLCPDGSTVLREGPQCEYAACPSAYGEEGSWQTAKDKKSGVTFSYPAILDNNNFVTASEWPPQFVLSKNPYSCVVAAAPAASSSTTHEETVGSNTYCIQEEKEGAAGSTYTAYTVIFPKENKTLTMSFTIQTVQCLNYDGSQQSACQAAQAAFKVEELVDVIAETVRL